MSFTLTTSVTKFSVSLLILSEFSWATCKVESWCLTALISFSNVWRTPWSLIFSYSQWWRDTSRLSRTFSVCIRLDLSSWVVESWLCLSWLFDASSSAICVLNWFSLRAYSFWRSLIPSRRSAFSFPTFYSFPFNLASFYLRSYIPSMDLFDMSCSISVFCFSRFWTCFLKLTFSLAIRSNARLACSTRCLNSPTCFP